MGGSGGIAELVIACAVCAEGPSVPTGSLCRGTGSRRGVGTVVVVVRSDGEALAV
jgi:hypothetical protein